jgi:hypothetical protein
VICSPVSNRREPEVDPARCHGLIVNAHHLPCIAAVTLAWPCRPVAATHSIGDIHQHWTVENGEWVNNGNGLHLKRSTNCDVV